MITCGLCPTCCSCSAINIYTWHSVGMTKVTMLHSNTVIWLPDMPCKPCSLGFLAQQSWSLGEFLFLGTSIPTLKGWSVFAQLSEDITLPQAGLGMS